MILHTNPWPYCIVDDLVDSEFTKLLADFIIDQESHKLFQFGQFDFGHEIHHYYQEYHSKIKSQTQQIIDWFPQTRLYDNLDFVCHVAWQPADYTYPPHCEHPDKIISLITYLYPVSAPGTLIHETEHGPVVAEIPWQVGRTLVFAGLNDITWHSYHSGNAPRATLCGFIVNQNTTPNNL